MGLFLSACLIGNKIPEVSYYHEKDKITSCTQCHREEAIGVYRVGYRKCNKCTPDCCKPDSDKCCCLHWDMCNCNPSHDGL